MNFCRGYKVPPRSILNIRQIAEHVREVVGDPKNAMGQILEELLYSGTLDVVPNDDPRLARGVEAVYIPEDKCIRLRDCDYEACILGTRTRSMFTFWHEFGHLILGMNDLSVEKSRKSTRHMRTRSGRPILLLVSS